MNAVAVIAPDVGQEEECREALVRLLAALERFPDPALPRDPFDVASETA